MFDTGCVGFYDFKKPIKNANLLKTALQYVQHFDGLIFSFPLEESISKNLLYMKVLLAQHMV